MGPPGSGKGTLSLMCIEKFGWGWLSTGDLCRFHIAQSTPIGLTVDSIIKSGNLIPDDLVVEMVFDWLVTSGASYDTILLDGCPRTVLQAEKLYALMQKNYVNPVSMTIIRLLLPDEQVVQRLMNRYICSSLQCKSIYTKEQLEKNKDNCALCEKCQSKLIRRVDDTEKIIRDRLATYYKYEHELLAFYEACNIPVITCKTNKPLEHVFNEFKNSVECVSI